MTVRMILEDDKDEEGDIQQDGGGLDRRASARGEWYRPTP